jgi:uracil-DNA glycosylase family 4
MTSWKRLDQQIADCKLCPRLREYCGNIAAVKRRAYATETYWGRPVPNFGVAPAGLLIVGLAPAAHGGNRTGRVFTGDRSGDWLFRALHKAGFANQPHATHRGDGLKLIDCAITAACHCAPPDNKPLPEEIASCRPWLDQTFALVQPRVVLALGQIGWKAVLNYYKARGELARSPKFGHGVQYELPGGLWLLASFHPSQQNTFTGKLTEPMFDVVFTTARRLVGAAQRAASRLQSG